MKRKVSKSFIFFFLTVLIAFCVHGISEAAQAAFTGESSAQDKKDNDYMSMLAERSEVSFLDFQPGPLLKAEDIFYDYSIALNFVRLHSPYSSTALTLEEVRNSLYYVHSQQVNLEEQIECMAEMRRKLSIPEETSIEPVYYNDDPAVYEAGKQNLVEVPKVIYHAYLNGKPYAAVVRFDAYSGEGPQMKLYQGYMTLLRDEYNWSYYHCSGLTEIE
ncbi:MAG: hypothetical protein KBA53_04495 [Thermoclostridium sp.]|nr:hypothetical protein [Thermoclostridium sp.]